MDQPDLATICLHHGLRLQEVLQETSDSFTARVRDQAGRDFVLKRIEREQGLGVRAGLDAWADTGLTPRVVAEPEPDLLLLEWISGPSLAELPPIHPLEVAPIGRALARLHHAEVPAASADVRAAFPRLAESWDHLHPDLQPLAAELTLLLQAADPMPSVLLHGDLVPYNIILTPEGPRFIDPLATRGFPSWDLAKLAVSWRALGRSGILAALLDGYGSVPPLLAEVATWITLVYLQKNLPFPASPLTPHLIPLANELRAARTPEAFLHHSL